MTLMSINYANFITVVIDECDICVFLLQIEINCIAICYAPSSNAMSLILIKS